MKSKPERVVRARFIGGRFIEIPAMRIICWTIHEPIEQLVFDHPLQGVVLQLKCHSVDVEENVVAAIGMFQQIIAVVTFTDFNENEIFVAGFHLARNRRTRN